jgi:hypothetical protein
MGFRESDLYRSEELPLRLRLLLLALTNESMQLFYLCPSIPISRISHLHLPSASPSPIPSPQSHPNPLTSPPPTPCKSNPTRPIRRQVSRIDPTPKSTAPQQIPITQAARSRGRHTNPTPTKLPPVASSSGKETEGERSFAKHGDARRERRKFPPFPSDLNSTLVRRGLGFGHLCFGDA